MKHYDLAIIGAGSGGCGAAIAAARAGLSVLLVEKFDWLGGTSTTGGVHNWAMGVGGTGIPFDLYRRLRRVPDGIAIDSIGRHFCYQEEFYWPHTLDKVNFPGGEAVIDPDRHFVDSLRRHHSAEYERNEAFSREFWHCVPFEPGLLSDVIADVLRETGCCDVRTGTSLLEADARGGHVRSATLDDGSTVRADAWVDATGDAVLCRASGCEVLVGRDPKSLFNEPSAPEQPSDDINGVSLIYRVTPVANSAVEPLPEGIPADCWWASCFPPVSCSQYPNLDRNCNMLPTMRGEEFVQRGYEDALDECRRRVAAHWHFIQANFPEFRSYRLSWTAPLLGVRESGRVVAEYMLTEHDAMRGLRGQTDPDLIAIADHALDRHGDGGGCLEVPKPYGVPYRCLVPKGFGNLLVACRGAGFSSLAASSCRLSRTMMQLGQAAGNAAALARQHGVELPDVPPDELRARLRQQHCQLDWPLPDDLRTYLEDE